MEKIQAFMEKYIGPFANKLNDSKYVKALTAGMMATMPITLGIAAIAILINLPIPAWTSLLESTGYL